MRKSIALISAALISAAGYAQVSELRSKLNSQGYLLLKKYEMALQSRASGGESDITVPDEITVILSPNNGYSAMELEKIPGVKVLNPGKKIALVSIPLGEVENVAKSPVTKRMSFGEVLKGYLDKARPASQVTELQSGMSYELPQNYSGEGVLLGMMDEGLDPNHINFMNSSLTANRIKQVWYMPSSQTSSMVSYSTPSAIASFTTDNNNATHATHVAGIMGGSYTGIGEVAATNASGNLSISQTNVPYYGVAPQAEMALNCGALYNSNIGVALNNFYEYAKAQGKPGAFNLSLGNNYGAHDGTSILCQLLDEYTDDVVVCVAAGNEGEENITIRKTLASSTDKIQTIVATPDSKSVSCVVQAWNSNSSILKTSFAIVDISTGNIVYSYPVNKTDADILIYGKGGKPSINTSGMTEIQSPDFSSAFTVSSYANLWTYIDSENDRFCAEIDMSLTQLSSNTTLYPAIIVQGNAGNVVNLYLGGSSDATEFTDFNLSGFSAGNPDMSINDLATAKGVISVGSYISRISWPNLGGYTFGFMSGEDGDVSSFTSYGVLDDGRQLPNFCAPGQGILSSFSTYYMDVIGPMTYYQIDANNKLTYYQAASTSVDRNNLTNGGKADRTDYWFEMQGTSMATPYITGLSALLLEQDPTLTTAEVRDLLESTAEVPSNAELTSVEQLQWGSGRVNGLKAMQKLVGSAGAIGDVRVDTEDKILIEQTDTELTASLTGERGVSAKLYSIAGYNVASGSGTGESVTLNISNLAKGVYVLTLTSADGAQISKRVLVGQH